MRRGIGTWILVAATIGAAAGCSSGGCSSGTGTDPTRVRDGGGGIDSGEGVDLGTPPSGEVCNQVDDTGEGLVDEGCSCDVDTAQPCWPSAAARRGLGACHDGYQRCEPFGEFLAWGGCVGAALPTAEIDGNCVDEDCDGSAPGCGVACGEIEDCANGTDDDCDALVDCADLDCVSTPACTASCVPSEFGETSCSDGVDNDCDGLVDCVDGDCATIAPCVPPPPPPPGCVRDFPFFVEIICGDGRDNDCDTLVDCADPDCVSPGNCGCPRTETVCGDGVDQDCDHSADCADTDCQNCIPGTFRWCDDPTYCHWGRQDCGGDGHWGACIETVERPGSCDGTIYSASCCVSAGGCCENYPTDHSSIGTCTGITTCGS